MVIVSQLRVHVSELWKLTINYTSLGIGSRFCCMRYISAWGFGRVLYNASEHSSITTGSKLAVFSVTWFVHGPFWWPSLSGYAKWVLAMVTAAAGKETASSAKQLTLLPRLLAYWPGHLKPTVRPIWNEWFIDWVQPSPAQSAAKWDELPRNGPSCLCEMLLFVLIYSLVVAVVWYSASLVKRLVGSSIRLQTWRQHWPAACLLVSLHSLSIDFV